MQFFLTFVKVDSFFVENSTGASKRVKILEGITYPKIVSDAIKIL
jgi:hypothetical protein